MPTPIIRKIKSLSGLAVFREFSADASLPDFRRRTLVYGFNGSGKTTLSRVFRSLEAGQLHRKLPAEGRFEIELSDDTRITHAQNLERLKGKLLTFSTDFVEENIQWSENKAKPVFYIGRHQAELAGTLAEANEKLAELEMEEQRTRLELGHWDGVLADFKRDVARNIAEELTLGRLYNASHLAADFAQASYDDRLILEDNERQKLRSITLQDEPLPKRKPLPTSSIEVADHIERVRKILTETIGSIAIEELAAHPVMAKWVKEGLEYHREHELENCLFCGNELTKSRKEALAEIVGERFNKLVEDIHELNSWCQTYLSRVGQLREAIPSRNDISKELQEFFEECALQLSSKLFRAEMVLKHAMRLIEQKANAPNLPIEDLQMPTANELHLETESLREAHRKLSEMIEKHNASHDDFTSLQAEARQRLKSHFLAENQDRYRQLNGKNVQISAKLSQLEQQIAAQRTLLSDLDHKLRQHGAAAQKINKLVSNYLGHCELEIAAVDDGYELRRNGQVVTGALSEGEKTAIAFCYFLSTTEADGRRPQDLIIVVDDPISSLDTKAMHYAFSAMKTYLAGC